MTPQNRKNHVISRRKQCYAAFFYFYKEKMVERKMNKNREF